MPNKKLHLTTTTTTTTTTKKRNRLHAAEPIFHLLCNSKRHYRQGWFNSVAICVATRGPTFPQVAQDRARVFINCVSTYLHQNNVISYILVFRLSVTFTHFISPQQTTHVNTPCDNPAIHQELVSFT